MAAPPADIKTLGRYDIQAVLGKGAMGVVYAGMDPRLHRKVAIKTILKSALDEDTAREYTMRFDREAQAVARLNHPNIVQVYDFGAEGDVAYIVMEFIQGKELKDFFDANERFDIKEAVHIMGELCEALHFAHEAGIIHRDIKPANVMIDSKGRVKLADFGVARITDADRSASEKTQAGAIVGTPAYMSPEQIEGGEIDRRTDIFSAGIILYQFLTGEKPFTGTSTWTIAKKILQDEPVMPSRLNTNISPLFDAIISKALAKNMNARYQNARDLGADLKNALEGKATTDDSDKTIVGSLAFDASLPPAAIAATPAGASGSHSGQTGTQEVELEFWRSIKDGNDADDFDLYVKQFPDGIYAALAKRKSAKLRGVASEETATKGLQAAEQEKRELEEAARREAEVKAKLAEEKAKLEAELEKREADYQKRAADIEAKREIESKARAEKDALEKAEFEAKLAKREADLQVQLKKQEEELRKNEEELKKKAAETAHLTQEIRKKKGSPLVPVAIGLLVAAIGGGSLYYFTRSPDTQALMAALEVAKRSNEQLIQARQGEQLAMKELEEAKKREAEAKASGDVAKQQQLAEETRRKEAELQRQGDLVKQKEAEAKAAVAKAEEAAKKTKESEAQKKAAAEKAALDKVAQDKLAQDKAVQDRAAAEKGRVVAEKAAAEKAEADKLAAEKAAAEKVAAAKVAPPAAAAPAAPKPAPEAPKTKITASTGAAERLAIREEEAMAKKAAEARAAAPSAAGETKASPGEQVASLAPSVDPAAPKVSLYQQGRAAESSGNIKQAVRLYVRAVRAGEFDAAKSLGDIFADGKGDVTKDYAESLKYYAIAEKNGVKLERTSGRGR